MTELMRRGEAELLARAQRAEAERDRLLAEINRLRVAMQMFASALMAARTKKTS